MRPADPASRSMDDAGFQNRPCPSQSGRTASAVHCAPAADKCIIFHAADRTCCVATPRMARCQTLWRASAAVNKALFRHKELSEPSSLEAVGSHDGAPWTRRRRRGPRCSAWVRQHAAHPGVNRPVLAARPRVPLPVVRQGEGPAQLPATALSGRCGQPHNRVWQTRTLY